MPPTHMPPVLPPPFRSRLPGGGWSAPLFITLDQGEPNHLTFPERHSCGPSLSVLDCAQPECAGMCQPAQVASTSLLRRFPECLFSLLSFLPAAGLGVTLGLSEISSVVVLDKPHLVGAAARWLPWTSAGRWLTCLQGSD